MLACAALILLARLGQGHLANYDDCYYAQKAKEMVRDGHWLVPHYAGIPRTDNPPLFLWLMAISFAVVGVGNVAAILPSALSGVACVWLTWRLAARLGLDEFESWCAGFVLLGTSYFLKYSRHAMFDVFVAMLFLLGMLAYRRAFAGERRYFLGLGVVAGLGVLTKSVLGLFPLIVAVAHLMWMRRWRTLADRWFLLGGALAVAIPAPWFVFMHAAYPQHFLREHFGWLLWERGFGGEQQGWGRRLQYVREIAAVYWPWLPLAVVGMWREGRAAFGRKNGPDPALEKKIAQFRWWPRTTFGLLLLWLIVVVGLLSLAHEKKLWYVMSAFPCLALFTARGLGAWVRGAPARDRVVRWSLALVAAAGLALNLLPIRLHHDRRPDLQAMALAARAAAPRAREIANLDASYWAVNNQFLFYSDRNLTLPLGEPDSVRARLAAGDWALLTVEGYARVAGADSAAYPAVAREGRWVLARGGRP